MKCEAGVLFFSLFVSSAVFAGNLPTMPNTFSAGTTASAAQVNANFEAARAAVDDNANNISTNVGDITNVDNALTAHIGDTAAALFFGGSGAAGDLTVSANTTWTTTPPAGNNLSFNNVVIDASRTLTVPAGTTIRCTGSFTNNGTLAVSSAGNGGYYSMSSSASQLWGRQPGAGDTPLAASSPLGATVLNVGLNGGASGSRILKTTAASSFNSFRVGGGGGSGHQSGTGGHGGGLVKIYCNGAIVNNGVISANGSNVTGGGGGGGGIVILASSTSIANDSGSISVVGGNGGNSASNNGIGGGGGGGIIVFVAPAISNTGSTSVLGGLEGSLVTNPLTSAAHSGGGSGGGSGGIGGVGGSVNSGNVPSTGSTDGGVGYVLEIQDNPIYHMN